ncbi:hypothetical protein EYF80_009836 [Liparis tanakae]|uniref:Uncharacterized protein n=1 Tax=Liparis tanakae TaxID=230148 RepID=A0A4Z2IP53_9TELE|nr:hypothetical protein EYF80_009836 [Liparis tanakae]
MSELVNDFLLKGVDACQRAARRRGRREHGEICQALRTRLRCHREHDEAAAFAGALPAGVTATPL